MRFIHVQIDNESRNGAMSYSKRIKSLVVVPKCKATSDLTHTSKIEITIVSDNITAKNKSEIKLVLRTLGTVLYGLERKMGSVESLYLGIQLITVCKI